MSIKPKRFRVRPGRKVDLGKWPTRVEPVYRSKKDYDELLAAQIEDLRRQQVLLYAANSQALLVIFQAMDAAGKDGIIKHVMSGVNPQGCQVYSFKHPSAEELDHDFLWRTTRVLPERGRIGIFNRSYYEDVLIVRVHPDLLRAQKLPEDATEDPDIWKKRYESINDLERHLHRNGTQIVKFFLHLSKDEQQQRFLRRIDDPERNWKFSADDIRERAYWKDYMKAYQACLAATSSAHAPWYIVPADDKENARLITARIIVETLQGLDLSYPRVSAAERHALQVMRRRLVRGKA
jgi:PPK2 family polyphosphate:nucleotide phosphotransferase